MIGSGTTSEIKLETTYDESTIHLFLEQLTDSSKIIDVSEMKIIGRGETHDIYRSDKHSNLVLKVMRNTAGQGFLEEKVEQLKNQYITLYEVFEKSRCIIEKRSVQSIKSTDGLIQTVIVSVAPFDHCFESKEKFGFDVIPLERIGERIKSQLDLYQKVSQSLLGSDEKSSVDVMNGYPILYENFEKIFKWLDTDETLQAVMREFLGKYRLFYKKTGIILDTIGNNNVIFYKANGNWQFKLGSVIKSDLTGLAAKALLDQVLQNPKIAEESLPSYLSTFYMPSCIRTVNICAQKVGIKRVIDNIIFTDETIAALAEIHEKVGTNLLPIPCIPTKAITGEILTINNVYNQKTTLFDHTPDTKDMDTPDKKNVDPQNNIASFIYLKSSTTILKNLTLAAKLNEMVFNNDFFSEKENNSTSLEYQKNEPIKATAFTKAPNITHLFSSTVNTDVMTSHGKNTTRPRAGTF